MRVFDFLKYALTRLAALGTLSPEGRGRGYLASSNGNAGLDIGRRARLRSARSESSPAMRFTLIWPQPVQRWTMAHSPSGLASMAMGSMGLLQGEARSPGRSSTWRLKRHAGQWLRCLVPQAWPGTCSLQWMQVKPSASWRRPDRLVGLWFLFDIGRMTR